MRRDRGAGSMGLRPGKTRVQVLRCGTHPTRRDVTCVTPVWYEEWWVGRSGARGGEATDPAETSKILGEEPETEKEKDKILHETCIQETKGTVSNPGSRFGILLWKDL